MFSGGWSYFPRGTRLPASLSMGSPGLSSISLTYFLLFVVRRSSVAWGLCTVVFCAFDASRFGPSTDANAEGFFGDD